MRAKLRREMAAAKCCAVHALSERFGPPSTLCYGNPTVIGDARDSAGRSLFANADHEHGFPTAVDSYLEGLTNQIGFYTDILPRLPNGCNSSGSRVGAHLDGPGLQAAFGAEALTVGSASNHMLYGNTIGTLTTTRRTHHARRTRRFVMRVKPTATVPGSPMNTKPASKRAIVGCYRTSTNLDLGTLTDGIFFFVELNAAGLGNWRATCMADGAMTEVDLGASMDVVPVSGGFQGRFQIFEIQYDGAEATFFLTTGVGTADSRVLTATISEHVPESLVAGWGTGCDQVTPGNTQPQGWAYDGMIFIGHRHIEAL